MKIKFINNNFNYKKRLKIVAGALFISMTITSCGPKEKRNEFGDILVDNPYGGATSDFIPTEEPTPDEVIDHEDVSLLLNNCDYSNTYEILRILDNFNCKASFVINSDDIDNYLNEIKNISMEGHDLIIAGMDNLNDDYSKLNNINVSNMVYLSTNNNSISFANMNFDTMEVSDIYTYDLNKTMILINDARNTEDFLDFISNACLSYDLVGLSFEDAKIYKK